MSDLTGQILGRRYHLVTRLGRGGMADVYQAYQPLLDRYVAIKVLHSHLAEEEDFIGRFEREPKTVARLRHNNIVQVHDFDVEGGLYYMVMELVEGPTLRAELEARSRNGQSLNLAETVRIITALASAIDYAHTRGMVHHDLKPSNIMFTATGEVVLTDFGVARLVGATYRTLPGSIYGTPAYIAPEQAQGERGESRSDIYALGVILYEIVTSQLPFEADTPFALIMKHLNEPPSPPTTIKPDIPKSVNKIILKALSKKPEDRYQRADKLALALQEAVGLTVEELLATTTITTIAPPPKIEEVSVTINQALTGPLECPYQGLYAFQVEDAPVFFGREVVTERLVEAVQEQAMVAVIGPSGSGKSSLVYAGLMAQLRGRNGVEESQENSRELTRSRETWLIDDRSPEETWLIADFRPSTNPFQSLANALIPLLEPEMSEIDQLMEIRKLADALSQGNLSLIDVVDRILSKNPANSRMLLVADQFEELYTLCSDMESRHRFSDMLLEAVEIPQFRSDFAFTFVLTLRADFLGRVLAHRPFADAMQNADVKLVPFQASFD